MSKEAFIGIMIGVFILFVVIINLWFSSDSILRIRLPQKQVKTNQVQNNQVETEVNPQEDQVDVTVSATEYQFEPNVINASVGQKVVINVHNDGAMKHDFNIRLSDDKYATKLIEPGSTETIEFEVNDPGQYPFYCSVPGHRDDGMEGTLEVR